MIEVVTERMHGQDRAASQVGMWPTASNSFGTVVRIEFLEVPTAELLKTTGLLGRQLP